MLLTAVWCYAVWCYDVTSEGIGLFCDVSHWKSYFTSYFLSLLCSIMSFFIHTHSSSVTQKSPTRHKCPCTPSQTHNQITWFINDADMRIKKKNLAASVKLIHDQLIQLFMIKDFYIVRTQLWLLIVVSVEMYLPFVINKPETWRITCVLSECHIQAVWQNQVRIAEENICHYWTEALPSACNMINHNSISVIDCTGCAWGRE